MRVVILADVAAPTGGAPKVALESARALAEAGANVTYLHSIGSEGDPRLDHPRIERVGLGFPDVWDRPAIVGAAAGIWNPSAAAAAARYLDGLRHERDVVLHLHQWTRGFSPSILPRLLGSGRPLAITAHDYFLACPNGVYYRFDRDEPCGLVPLSAGCVAAPCDPRSRLHKVVRVLRTALAKASLGNRPVDLVHVSERGRDTLAPFLPGLRHHRIDNPVDVARRPPAEIGPDAKVAYVGRLTREKGADLAALAAREAGTPVMFIGEGPAEAEIRRLNPDAEMLGWRSPGEVASLLRGRVRAVIAPSRWSETGPLTVYEGLASGVPAIASSRSGAAEKVAHGETGFVVEPQLDALVPALRSLADNAAARRLGRAAYDRYWRAPPTPKAHAARLIELYETMLGDSPALRAGMVGPARRSGPPERPFSFPNSRL